MKLADEQYREIIRQRTRFYQKQITEDYQVFKLISKLQEGVCRIVKEYETYTDTRVKSTRIVCKESLEEEKLLT